MPRLHHDLEPYLTNACWAGQRQMTANDKTELDKTEQEHEVQVRNLMRLVSACTLGLWSFSAGLLIGSFLLF
jgi:hypothetical protein